MSEYSDRLYFGMTPGLDALVLKYDLSLRANETVTRWAIFSRDERYRYLLAVRVGDGSVGSGICAFIGLNPSTATERTLENGKPDDDPTLRKCQEFARRWGRSWVWMLNAYAIRGTDPKTIKRVADPVGPANNAILIEAAQYVRPLVCAWGRHASHLARGARVKRELQAAGVPLLALGTNQDGSPEHPLYLPYERTLQPWL